MAKNKENVMVLINTMDDINLDYDIKLDTIKNCCANRNYDIKCIKDFHYFESMYDLATKVIKAKRKYKSISKVIVFNLVDIAPVGEYLLTFYTILQDYDIKLESIIERDFNSKMLLILDEIKKLKGSL